MRIGFTGTREGMTPDQRFAFIGVFEKLTFENRIEFHHGCCLGADFDAADIAYHRCVTSRLIAHPSDLSGMTSGGAKSLSQQVLPVKPPLDRNRDIVDACDVLLACPKGPEERRSGTWATVRYARKQGKRIVIIWPDGKVEG